MTFFALSSSFARESRGGIALFSRFALSALALATLLSPFCAHAAGAVPTGSVAQGQISAPAPAPASSQSPATAALPVAAEPKTPISATGSSSAAMATKPLPSPKPSVASRAATGGKTAPLSAEETLKAAADKVSQSKPRVIFSSDTPIAQSPMAPARANTSGAATAAAPAGLTLQAQPQPQTPTPATLPQVALPAEAPVTAAAIPPPLALPPLPGMSSGPLALPPLPSGTGIPQASSRSARRAPSIPGAEFTPAPTIYRAPPVCPSKALLAKAIVSFGGSFQADVCFGGELHPGLSLGDTIAGAKIVSISDNVVVLRSGRGKDQKLVVSQHFDE